MNTIPTTTIRLIKDSFDAALIEIAAKHYGCLNKVVFVLSRAIKDHFNELPLPAETLCEVFLNRLPPATREEIDLAAMATQLETTFPTVKSGLRSGALSLAVETAREKIATGNMCQAAREHGITVAFQLFIQLCHELQRNAATGQFMLAQRNVAELIAPGRQTTISNWIKRLAKKGVLIIVRQGTAKERVPSLYKMPSAMQNEAAESARLDDVMKQIFSAASVSDSRANVFSQLDEE